MESEKMREEFEAAISKETGEPITAVVLSRYQDSYATSALHYAWWAWKASREAIVIYLEPDEPADEGAAYLHQDFVKARIIAGLKVKP